MTLERKERSTLSPCELPFFLVNTGHGFTTTFEHQVHARLEGEVCPVVAKIRKGYATDGHVYQAVEKNRPFVRIWAAGSVNPKTGWRSGIEYFRAFGQQISEAEAIKLGAKVEKLKESLSEVESWQNGRQCHWPPGKDQVESVDFGLLKQVLKMRTSVEVASLVQAIWEGFPLMAEWHIKAGEGEAISQRGLTLDSGLEGRWRVHLPPVRPEYWFSPVGRLGVAHHFLEFNPPIYVLAADQGSRRPNQAGFWKAIAWAPKESRVAIHDLQEEWRVEDVEGNFQGIFWIRHWPAEGRD